MEPNFQNSEMDVSIYLPTDLNIFCIVDNADYQHFQPFLSESMLFLFYLSVLRMMLSVSMCYKMTEICLEQGGVDSRL